MTSRQGEKDDDRTERGRAEESLNESEARFRAMFENSGSGMALIDIQGHPIECNPTFLKTLGYSEEELRGMSFIEFTHPDDRELNSELYGELMAGKCDKYEIEKRYITKDGRTIWGNVITSLIRNEDGSPQYAVGMMQDITERKRAEEELRLSEERFAKAFHASPEASTIHRHRDGVFLEVNERWLSIYGYTREEVIGRSTKEMRLSSPEVRDTLRRTLEEQGSLRNYEIALRTKRGEIRQVSLSAELFVINGETCSIYLQLDITERKRAEGRLRRYNEELRALSARLHWVREEESARIAREIHDELGASLSSLKWGLEEIGEDVSEASGAPPLAALRERVAGMITLTDNAVDAVRRIASELRPTALEEFGLAEAVRLHAEQFQSRTGIAVNCDCVVEGTELNQERATALFRIAQEALTNVLRHARATQVEIIMNREAGNFVLAVSDNGKGITKTEKSAPRSLGLLGMRERAHLLGGEINIESAEGRGTVVTVRVPVTG